MKSLAACALRACQRAILGLASCLVPKGGRADWLQEWRAELWHVRQSAVGGGPNPCAAEWQTIRFCVGALSDALCLRRIAWQNREHRGTLHGSAAQCIFTLSAILVTSYLLSQQLAGVSAESHPASYQVNPGLILIQNSLLHDDAIATVSAKKYRIWKARPQRYFDGFAFYRVRRDAVFPGAMFEENWQVAHASLNLFWLLGLPIQHAASLDRAEGETAGLVLSDTTWRRDFGANPRIAGSLIRVGSREERILGVASEGAWRMPGKVDAWLFQADAEMAGVGYVVAHLSRLGQSQMQGDRVRITPYNTDDPDDDLWGVSFRERTEGPWRFYVFTMILAFLALPAITSVELSEYNFSSHKPSLASIVRRWVFLWAKIVLLLPIAYYASMDLAYWHTTTYSIAAQYVQLISSFLICLFGLRWVLLDQRHRCPVCLRRVTHPARVGYAGRTFLAWNGTEMICTGGHTLLHVPALPTSWFSTQRWLYLDNSWSFLFAGPGTVR